MRTVLIALALVLTASAASAQTNPCAAAALPVVLSPTSEVLGVLSAAHTTSIGGFPAISEYVIGVFLPGVDPATGGQPMSTAVVAKTAWVLKTANCYGMPVPALLLNVPVNAEHYVAIRGRRTLPTVVEGAWGPLSNPFGVLGVPAAPTGTRITP